MRILIRDRGQGKTLELLHTSEMTQHRIITHTEREAILVADTAKKLGLQIPEPMSAHRYRMCSKGMRDEHLLVDNAENLLAEALSQYLGQPVVGIAMTVPGADNTSFERF